MARGSYPRRGGGGGGANMNALIKQAQKMQAEMEQKQEALKEQEFEAAAGGGVVTAVVSGDKILKKISIAPEAVDPDDVEMLEDLVLAAVNEAMRIADETVAEEMSKLTGGLNLGL